MSFLRRQQIETDCLIEIEHSQHSLHAHVTLRDGGLIEAGDRVTVHGDPVRLQFGETLRLQRPATIERASLLERHWTKLAARFSLCELYEVSFSSGRRL